MSNYKKYNRYFIYKLFYQYSAVYLRTHLNLEIVSVSKHFDRFYTVQDGNNSTGLGLSIAKLLTKKLRGEIFAHLENNILNITLII